MPFQIGNPGYWLGKKRPEKDRLKMSITHKLRGTKPKTAGWNKGLSKELQPSYKRTVSISTRNKLKISSKGKHYSPNTEFKKGMTAPNKGKENLKIRGENHPNWQGGITPLYRAIRHSSEYSNWYFEIKKRDKKTCQLCGISSNKTHVDHIIPLKKIVKIFNIKTLDDARDCEMLWDINNGRVLCVDCHLKTDTYGRRPIKN